MRKSFGNSKLWFAWKLVLLQYRKQLTLLPNHSCIRCDLLENSYFCSIANNCRAKQHRCTLVVICLKTRTFAVSQTTRILTSVVGCSCDLLENSYFCSIANNSFPRPTLLFGVVICLKTRTFAVSQTTECFRLRAKNCCDLLENSYFCSIANNLNTISICTTNRYEDLRNKKKWDCKKKSHSHGVGFLLSNNMKC